MAMPISFPDQDHNCGNCRFSRETLEPAGEIRCHLNPPDHHYAENGELVRWAAPLVSAERYWCGKWEPVLDQAQYEGKLLQEVGDLLGQLS